MTWLETMVAEDVNVELSTEEFAPEELECNDDLCEVPLTEIYKD